MHSLLLRRSLRTLTPILAGTLVWSAVAAESSLPPMNKVEIRDRAFLVNGQPFLPIVGWLQPPKNLALLKECGFNATAGYWAGSGGTTNAADYVESARRAGLYVVMPFQPSLKGNPNVLGYIHDDEPDLDRKVSDARIEPAKGLHLNPGTPMFKLVDGDLSSWTVLDPLEGSSVTIRPAHKRLARRFCTSLHSAPRPFGSAVPRSLTAPPIQERHCPQVRSAKPP